MPDLRLEAADLPLVIAGFGFALVAVLVLEGLAEGSRARRVARATLRAAVVAAVALALAAPTLVREQAAVGRLVLLVDESARRLGGGEAAAAAWIARAGEAARARGHALEVLGFDAAVHRGPAAAPDEGGRSRLAPALAAAGLLVGDDEAATVIVASDGRADDAGAADAAAALIARGIRVRSVAIPGPAPAREPATTIETLDVPESASGTFAVRARVRNARPGATARLLIDGVPASTPAVALAPDGTAAFDGLVLPPGLHDIALVVGNDRSTADGGGSIAARRSLVRVTAPPRVLVVSGGQTGALLRRTLSSQGFSASLVGAADAAEALAVEDRLDLVVLDADAVPGLRTGFEEALADRVRAGLGLFVAAGASSESWAALGRGALGPILPAAPSKPPREPLPPEPPPPIEPERPTPPAPDDAPEKGPGLSAETRPELAMPITLILVIDRSGSMREEGKLAMAIRSAEEAASTLAPTDRVGVISFSDEATLDTPVTALAITAAVGLVRPIEAAGDTDIFAGLALAAKVMAPETSPIRHILLLTDGIQTGSAYFTDLVRRMAEDRITLSTVGLGQSINEFRLKSLARLGNGRFFFAPTPQDLPRVLTRDTRTVVEERAARARLARLNDPDRLPQPKPPAPPAPGDPAPTPAMPPPPSESRPPLPPAPAPAIAPVPLLKMRAHEALLGLDAGAFPSVGMPRPARPASPTSTLLVRRTGEGVLLTGRAGLGRVIALALPVTDPGFIGWADATRLVAQAARSVTPPADSGPAAVVRVTQGPDGDRLRVAVPDGVDPSAVAARVRVRRRDAEGERDATLVEIDAGELVFELPTSRTDSATVLVEAATEEAGPPRALPPLAYVPSRAPESPEGSLEEALAASLRLPVSDDDAPDVLEVPSRRRKSPLPLAPYFAALAALLLPIDVALHRRGKAS